MAPEISPHNFILDSWPVMEWLKNRQPATEKFEAMIYALERNELTFAMSRINYGEVIYGIRKEPTWPNEKRTQALLLFQSVPLEIVSVTDQLVDEAVELKSRYSIAYADGFAAALSMHRRVPLITGDKELLPLEADGLLKLHWLGA